MENQEIIRSPRTPTPSQPSSRRSTTSTVLSQRHYKKVCLFSFVLFLISFLAVGVHKIASSNPICNHDFQQAQWAREWNIATAGSLVVAIMLQVNRISLSTFREESDIGTLSSYYASIFVNIISASAHLGALLFQWGGICRDAFGVYTPASIWPEWSISVPLLVFITVSVDDRPYLSREDILTIISLHLCIVCGALLQVTSDVNMSLALVVLSCIFCIPCVVMIWRSNRDLEYLLKKSMESETKRGLYQRRILLASRKATLSVCIGYLFPVFPVIYFLRLYRIIDDNFFFVAIMFASAFTKISFASLCMDAHLEVSHPAIALIDAENFANTSRRAFLRFVFHEVRVPLNSISMGVQVLESSDKIVDEDRDTVCMVKEAVNFMGETLNDVMALQKVEEGSLELIYKSFSVSDLFQNVEDSFIDTSVEYGVVLSTDIDPRIPARIIGDKFRIRHVLANLVSNALKYSYSGGHVQLRATLDTAADPSEYGSLPTRESGNFVTVIFSVVDEGKGISEADQEEDIFQPYRLLKHGELKRGRGTGLGLAICKEIVRMHSGQIWYTSKLGKGSTFNVSIPLEVSLDSKQRSTGTWHRQLRHKGSRRRLATKMMSHWNVMMATGSQADMIHSITPSPGLFSHNSSLPSSEIKKGLSSSSDGSIIVDPSLEDGDLFEVHRLSSGRAVKELSDGMNDSIKRPLNPRKMSRRDKKVTVSRTHSTKSLDLSESDLANVRRYETDDDSDILGDFSGKTRELAVENNSKGAIKSDENKEVNDINVSSNTKIVSGELTPATALPENSSLLPKKLSSVSHSSEDSHGVTDNTTVNSESTNCSASSHPQPDQAVASAVSHLTRIPKKFKDDDERNSNSNAADSSDAGRAEKITESVLSDAPSTTEQEAMSKAFQNMQRQSVSTIATPPSSLSNHRYSFYNVLIVDDVTSNRKLLALLLNKRGIHSITFAEDGSAGVEMVREKGAESFDLIFMDNTMPKMSGIEASRFIRKMGFDNLIIGVTGNSMEEELCEFIVAGADLVVTKPMKPHVLDILLQFVSTFGCRSHPKQRLVIRNTNLEWVNTDSSGHISHRASFL